MLASSLAATNAEVANVTILHHVLFAFHAQLARRFRRRHAARRQQILIAYNLSADKQLFKIRMDNPGAGRSLPALVKRPRANFLLARRKVSGQPEQVVSRMN